MRPGGIPKLYWGTWAPSASGCKEPDQRIYLSGEDYVGPEASCRVVSVSETPSQTEPNYSARLECSPKGVTKLIFQPKGKNTVLSGHDLQSLRPYHRCSINAAASAKPGQSPNPSILPSPPAHRPDQTNADRIAEWFRTCMGDWERATHMTKSEWRTTCRRVADERGRFVAEQQSLGNLPKTDKKSGLR